ncbi:fucose permease [Streptomyces candidus]|uniref:Fucose permease n=1 Tax=Streptomyces candidus TaxID=67283 RepID=A0A7X0LSL2_9ACTN|nr:fucose permease [Streptomyces candidus]
MRRDQGHWFLGKGKTPKQLKAYARVFAAFAILELAAFLATATREDPRMWILLLTGFGSVLFPTMLFLTLHYLRDTRGPKT